MLRKKTISKELYDFLKEHYFEFGGEGIIALSEDKKSIYKLYHKEVTKEERENKEKKLEQLYDQSVKHITTPKASLYLDGNIVGCELEYDEEEENLDMACLYPEEQLMALRVTKEILEYFRRIGIIYPDVKADNILINLNRGTIRFCDIDNIIIGNLREDILHVVVKEFVKKYGKLDSRIHSYLHNIMTIDMLDKRFSKEFNRNLEEYLLESNSPLFLGENEEIKNELIKVDQNYSGRYLIDGIKEENVVK